MKFRVLLILFNLLLIASLAGAVFYRPAHHAALALAGKARGCSPARAWSIDADKENLTRTKDQILAGSKLVRSDGNLDLYTTPYGEFWAPKGSQYILPFNLAEEATHIYGTGDRFVRKGDIVLDCGANVGTFLRFALNAGAKTVVAIEPAPDNIECLRRNFAKEMTEGRVILYPKGVWDKDDFLDFLVDSQNQAADSFVIHREGAQSVAKLPLTTIDKLVAELGLPKVDFIKMDIEGAEVRALRGAANTLKRDHPRMSLSVYHQDDHPIEVPKAVRAGWSNYRIECGPCAAFEKGLRPDILYFY